MSATPRPQRYSITLHTSTDQRWEFQIADEAGDAVVPTSAQAQIRSRAGGELWATLTCTVAPGTGIITVTAPRAATSGAEWDRRREGVWDLIVQQGTDRLRVLEGIVYISQEVTSWS